MILLRTKVDGTIKYVCLDANGEVYIDADSSKAWQYLDAVSAARVAKFIGLLDLFKKYRFEIFDTELVSAN